MIRQKLGGGWGMTSEWRTLPLGEFVSLQRGHDLPDQDRRPGTVPILGSFGVTGFHDTAKVKGPGVTIGRSGASFGVAAYTDSDYWPLNTALYVTDFRGNDPQFVFYVLKVFDFSGYNSGSGQPSLNRNNIYPVPIRIPSPDVQRDIANLVADFDYRIALLRETNATLEAIAQALFKSWFIDFDPVRAKQQGLAPAGIDEATAALFPDSFGASAEGLLPVGWEQTNLAALTERFGGSIQTGPFGSQLHASDYVEVGSPVVMPKDIHGRHVMTDSVARIQASDADRLSRHKVIKGDIVFSRRGDVERHALIGERETGWLCGTGCLLVRPGKGWASPTFLSMMLDACQARTWLVQHAVGATMPNLNTGILGSVPVVLRPPELLRAFEDIIAVTEEQRSQNASTAETLATIRDTLLPRLISGQLRLPQAEALLEEATA